MLRGQRDGRCNRLPVGWVWLAAGEGSADTRAEVNATHGDQSGGDLVQRESDPTGIEVARNGFGPRNCPKPSLKGAVYGSSAASG
jgi:hypothetical protein